MKMVIFCFLILSLAFASGFFGKLGIEMNGGMLFSIGIGYNIDNISVEITSQFARDQNTNIFASKLSLYSNFEWILPKISIQGIFPIGEEKFLLLAGIGCGVQFWSFESDLTLNYTIPVSAVKEIKGPLPSISLNYVKSF